MGPPRGGATVGGCSMMSLCRPLRRKATRKTPTRRPRAAGPVAGKTIAVGVLTVMPRGRGRSPGMSEFQLLNLYTDTMSTHMLKVQPTSQCAQPSVRHGREHRGPRRARAAALTAAAGAGRGPLQRAGDRGAQRDRFVATYQLSKSALKPCSSFHACARQLCTAPTAQSALDLSHDVHGPMQRRGAQGEPCRRLGTSAQHQEGMAESVD